MNSFERKIIYGDNTKAKKELGWEYELDEQGLIRQLIQDEISFSKWNNTRRNN